MTANLARGSGSRWTLLFWAAAALALLTPAIAMQFTREVDWTAFDFAFAGGMLAGVGLGLELAVRRYSSMTYRIGAGLALAAALLIVWITGAVGIIGSERDDANLLFLAVPMIALAAAALARFRPAGMARAMAAAALAQIVVPAIAWLAWPAAHAAILAPEVAGSTVVFTAMWLTSAWLFRKAGAGRAPHSPVA